MAEEFNYPTLDKIIEFNFLALTVIKVKKADKAETLSASKIMEVLRECESEEGDVYDKAAVLLAGIVQRHPFASGNRRTAFLAAKFFVVKNGGKFKIKDDESQAKVLQGVRERYYSDEELKEWIRNGKIREFKR